MTDGRPLGELIRLLEARGLLRTLLQGQSPTADVRVRGVTHDSRLVRPGVVFVAISGARQDGHDFIPQAVASGAVAVIGERAVARAGVPQLLVARIRPAMALAAAWYFDFPSHHLGVVGITGTDGKTTTSYLVRSMLEASGRATGLIGTIESMAGGKVIGTGRQTTPESPELQADLAAMVDCRRSICGGRVDLARPGPGSCRRGRLRRGRADQRNARAPRVPQDDRGLPRGQAQPVRAARRQRLEPGQGFGQVGRR